MLHVSMAIGGVFPQVLSGQPYYYDIICEASVSFLEDEIRKQTFWFSDSSNLPASSFITFSEPCVGGSAVTVSAGCEHSKVSHCLHFRPVVVFYNGSHLLQREVSLMRDKSYS